MYPDAYSMQDVADLGYGDFGLLNNDIALYNPLKYPGAVDPYLSSGEPLLTDSGSAFTTSSPSSIAGGDDWSPPPMAQYDMPQGLDWAAFYGENMAGQSDDEPQVNEGQADMVTDDHNGGSGEDDTEAVAVQTVCPADIFRDASQSTLGLVAPSHDTPSSSDDDGPATPPAAEATITTRAGRRKKAKPTKGKKWKKERYSDLVQLDDDELLSHRPYGNGEFVLPDTRRFKTRRLYILALPSGWDKLVAQDLPPERLTELKAEVEADAAQMLEQMGDRRVDTKEAKAVVRVKAIVTGRLECEIAQQEDRDPPNLPADAQLPEDKEFEQLRRQIRDRDWVRCVVCGKECMGREDEWYINRHAGASKTGGCPRLAVLVEKALIARWLQKHVNDIHDHDLVQLTQNRLTASSLPPSALLRAQSADELLPASTASAPTPAPPPPRRTSSRKKTGTTDLTSNQSNIGPQRSTRTKRRVGLPY